MFGNLPEIFENLNRRQLLAAILIFILVVGINFLASHLPWYFVLAGFIFCAGIVLTFRRPLVGLAAVAFFLPFERLGAYQAGDLTIRISQIFLLVTAVAWFVYVARKGKFGFAKNSALIFLVLFLMVGLISLPNSLNLGRSVMVLGFIIFTMLLAFLMPNILKKEEDIRLVVNWLFVSFVLVSLFGIFQFLADMAGAPPSLTGLRLLYSRSVLGFTRVQSTAYEPLYFANYLLLPLLISFVFFLSKKNFFSSARWLALFILGMVNIILTVSRGGYLAAAFALVVVVIYYIRRIFSLRNVAILGVSALIISWAVIKALGIGGGFFTYDRFKEHVSNAFYGASYDERVETFENALVAWREQPIVGIGIGGFGPYMATNPNYRPTDGWKIVNNEFVEILAETGILGLLFFILFIIAVIARSIKAIIFTKSEFLKPLMVALLAAFLGVIVQYQTFSTLYIMQIWFLIGLVISVQNAIFSQEYQKG